MKKILLALFLISSVSVASANTVTIGVINIQKVLDSIKEGKRVTSKLKKSYDNKKKKIKKEENKLKKQRDDLMKQASLLSAEARGKKERELQANFMALQKQTMDYQKEIQKQEAELKKPILEKIKKIVDEVSKKSNVDFTVEVSASPVVFAKSKKDLTAEVIKIYDSKFK